MNNKKIVEAGAASIFIEIDKGTITVRHGTDNDILLEKKNVVRGTWDMIWDSLKAIETLN